MMASTRRRAANQDLPRQPSLISTSSLSPLMADNAGSISMDDLLKNIYSDPNLNSSTAATPSTPDPPPPLFFPPGSDGNKTVDEVWGEIVAGPARQLPTDKPQMTLEDYLAKAAVRPPLEAAAAAGPGQSMAANGSLMPPQGQSGVVAGGGGGGRGKRRAAVHEAPPVDKATQQKQRRMIKNRESAARSRERKQAYTAELETLVMQLEEEHARLSREEVEMDKEKCEKLVKCVIPVTEGRRPQGTLQRLHSF